MNVNVNRILLFSEIAICNLTFTSGRSESSVRGGGLALLEFEYLVLLVDPI